jgi:hypothetical protein
MRDQFVLIIKAILLDILDRFGKDSIEMDWVYQVRDCNI